MRPLRSLVVLLSAVGLAISAAAPAHGADITRKKAIWGPVFVNGQSVMPMYAELGVGIYQKTLQWEDIAPTRPANPRDPSDPAYNWRSFTDDAISEAEKYGIEVLLSVSQVPEWASGFEQPYYAPRDFKDYVDFLEAAARRFPEVRHWFIWPEPNRLTQFFPPLSPGTSVEKGSARQQGQAYARILDMSYARLKKVSRRNLVIGGNSYFSTGQVPGFQPARTWIKNLKLPNGKPPRMDMYGHNPFSSRRPNLKQKPLNKTGLDFSDTDDLIKLVNKRLRRKRAKKLKVFLSEYTVQTERASNVFPYGVSLETQAKWIRDAYKIARRTKGIYSLGWFRVFDQEPDGSGMHALWGLARVDGEKKPGWFAFRDS